MVWASNEATAIEALSTSRKKQTNIFVDSPNQLAGDQGQLATTRGAGKANRVYYQSREGWGSVEQKLTATDRLARVQSIIDEELAWAVTEARKPGSGPVCRRSS